MKKLIKERPAVVLAFVAAAIALAVSFGLQLTAEQVAGINAFVMAGLGFVIQTQVSPVSSVVAQLVDGEVQAGPASEQPTGTPLPYLS